MSAPLWRASATIRLSRPSYNESDYGYQNSIVSERDETYSFSFEAITPEEALKNIAALVGALRGISEAAK